MQVVPSNFTYVEVVDGLRFRLFAVYNNDIREYGIVSKFTVARAVSAMVSVHICASAAKHLEAFSQDWD